LHKIKTQLAIYEGSKLGLKGKMNFNFLNIPVRIHPTFWIFLLFFTDLFNDPSIEGICIAAIVFFSLLWHEYGHASTAAFFGAKPRITLEAFGGYAEYNNFGISRLQNFIITLNGPLFQSLLIALPYLLLRSGFFASHYHLEYVLYHTMKLNILWCLLNLIPVEPLDGGHLLRGILEHKFGDKGNKVSLIIGLMSVALISPCLYFYKFKFFPILLLIFGIQNYQKLKNFRSNDLSPFALYMKGVDAENRNNREEAKQHFKRLLKSKDHHLKHSAIESLAKIYYQENKKQKSYELLFKADHQLLEEGKTLLCKLAFERKNHELVCKYSRDIYNLEPSYETAILNSQAFASMNQPELAGGWLATASQFGIEYNEKVKELLKQATYDSVRNHEAFQHLLR
jgi:stage IV sporulation protein FB